MKRLFTVLMLCATLALGGCKDEVVFQVVMGEPEAMREPKVEQVLADWRGEALHVLGARPCHLAGSGALLFGQGAFEPG